MSMLCTQKQRQHCFSRFVTRLCTLLLALGITLTGLQMISCASRALAQATLDDANAPGIAREFTPAAINWQPCSENRALECGTLILPVDYDQPHGETFDLAVIRAQALSMGQRLGVLFTHPGINESGVNFILGGVDNPVLAHFRERFDIVSLDPRGAGRTRPLDCNLDLPEAPDDQSDASLIAYFDDYGRRVAEQCLAQAPVFVLSISANNFARDIEMFRQALGERQLSFGMMSNSGAVAAVYAALFPTHVRAMLIDSTIAPEFRDYAIERWGEMSAGYEIALQRVDQLCNQNASCPLHDTGVIAAFDTVLASLKSHPVPTPTGDLLTARVFSDAFASLLPIEPRWPLIPIALAQALSGDFTAFFQMPPPPGLMDDSALVRNCNDYGTRRTAADYLPIITALGDLYPHFFDRLLLGSFIASCSAWPDADPPLIGPTPPRLNVPILLIGSEFDSNAPFAWTQRMAQTLGTAHPIVRYQGGGHGLAARSDIPCIRGVIDAYLFELQLPAEGDACPAVSLGLPRGP